MKKVGVNVLLPVLRDKQLFIIVTSIFFVALFGGMFISPVDNDTTELIAPNSLWDLIQNNIMAMLLIASGIFTFGISTFILLPLNGLIVGTAIRNQYYQGIEIGDILLKLLPHGTFEIPALIISGVIGLKSVKWVINSFKTFNIRNSILEEVRQLIFLLLMMIAFLIIGAVIEWYIT
ncbi:stage II sporulation protein M [Salipaludibacillus agaradhaerens]|jgi:uncharacterized membrane protein SpoIIM required for sporulation|uniref:Stage II sporulation protein M n=1 Tax=Salipaludibacillus agaradhaerens TaxID=76935 RepID=A0A9Q4B4Q1_SALAG|nr:stage II sporulation protein M [Salipaludibacillus agaradhaerens]MCR6098287.1 stage II sporulation protein M [Salipaludibacillus agaradhaerens]MCR6116083.1 stage II sporulation protein M [Salipaludibacillus agaradhaerens]